MKKILATTLAFVLLSTVFFVSKVPVRAAEDTTTTGKFLSATKSTPEKTNNVTYETDNSNVSKTFGTALKITPGYPGQLNFAKSNPISGGKGMLMYAKTEADGKTTTPMVYIAGENDLNAYAQAGTWYILTENGAGWEERTYSNYGCELESGFEGYIYIPFSNYLMLNDTDKITGYNLYLLKGGSYENNNITLGQPIIATSDGIPNAKSINCDGTEYVYFAVEDTTTTGTFLSATRSIPETAINVTYETDNSNVSKTFGTALKITPGYPGQLNFAKSNPISGGKGMLMYAKTEADGKTTTPMVYIAGENDLNAYAQAGTWYILTENGAGWEERTYSNYGCELESGFEGYIYIPFSNYLMLNDTDKITGYNLYLLKGGSYENNNITLGQPIIVTSEGIPNAEKIECGDWAYYYFGKKAPQYNGMITEAVAMDYDLNFNASDPTIPFDKENGIYPISGNHYKKRVRPAIDSSGFKLGSAFKFTTLTYTDEQGKSCKPDSPIFIKVKENDIAAHGMMLYVKTENDGKPYGIQVYINGRDQYSGSAYALKRGGSTWESVGFASQYGPVLESGFEGYVYFPFVGGFAKLDNTAINTYTLYLTAGNNSEGQAIYEEGRSIIVSKPVAITSDLGDNPPSPEMLKFGNETKSYFTEAAPKVLGDANGDKTTDIRDLIHLKSVLANLSEETENADVDNNGVIDSFDLAALRKIMLGILG